MALAPLLLLVATLPQRHAPPQPPRVAPPGSGDEAALRAAHLGGSGTELLRFFRRRRPPAPGRAGVRQWDGFVVSGIGR